MTAHYGAGVLPERMSDAVLSNPESADCLIPMGITSENVAKQYNISRDVQDTFAANSFAKAAEAQKLGKFKEEIVPVRVSMTRSRSFCNALTPRSSGPTPRLRRRRRLLSTLTMESELVSPRSPSPSSSLPSPRTVRLTPVTLRKSRTVPPPSCSLDDPSPRSSACPFSVNTSPALSLVSLPSSWGVFIVSLRNAC